MPVTGSTFGAFSRLQTHDPLSTSTSSLPPPPLLSRLSPRRRFLHPRPHLSIASRLFLFAFRWTVLHSFRTSLTFITASASFTFTSPYQETQTLFTPSSNRRPNNIDDPIQRDNSCIGQHLQESTKPLQSCVKPTGIHSFSRFRLGTIHPFDNPQTHGIQD